MNTLEEFYERFRCADTYYMTYDDAERLETLVLKSGPEDYRYLKVILPRILRGFKAYYEETKPKLEKLTKLEQASPCSCSPVAESKT